MSSSKNNNENESQILKSKKDQKIFLNAILNPAPANVFLKQAFKEHIEKFKNKKH